jgi:hypothetical protein
MSSLGVNNAIYAQNVIINSQNVNIENQIKVIRNTDMINIPFTVINHNLPIEISLQFTSSSAEAEVNFRDGLRISAIEDFSLEKNFIIGSYLYKKYLHEINNLRVQLETTNVSSLIEELEQKIERDSIFLNLFKDDVLDLLNSIKSSIPSLRSNNFTSYNRTTQSIDYSISVRSPRVSSALRMSRRTPTTSTGIYSGSPDS